MNKYILTAEQMQMHLQMHDPFKKSNGKNVPTYSDGTLVLILAGRNLSFYAENLNDICTWV